MRLLVGLGNPGAHYAGNRHNIGFMAIEAIARRHGFGPWRRRFQGVATEGPLGGERVILLLPETFMNEFGRAVAEAARFFKIGVGDIVVFHDEIDLPPAKVRVKTGGGNAGHNGLRSISAHVGNDYRRVRIGVGHPGDKELVLQPTCSAISPRRSGPGSRPSATSSPTMPALIVKGDDASFQNKVHLAMQAKGFDAEPAGKAGSA